MRVEHAPFRIMRQEREFFIDNLLVRTHFVIVMIRWTGLAPWEFDHAATSTIEHAPFRRRDEGMRPPITPNMHGSTDGTRARAISRSKCSLFNSKVDFFITTLESQVEKGWPSRARKRGEQYVVCHVQGLWFMVEGLWFMV